MALALYAGFGILWPSAGSLAETLCALLGLGMVLVYGSGLRSSGPMWLLLAALLVQTLSWALGAWHHPEWVGDNPKLDRLAKLFIFIAVAWWLGGSTRNTLLVWSLALLGYLVASFTHGDGLQEWLAGLQGQRVGFGIRNLQHGSMLFGVALLGLVVFTTRFGRVGGRWVPWRITISLLLIGLCLVGIAIGQTRAVWLAVTLALTSAGALWLGWTLMCSRVSAAHPARPVMLTAGGLLVVVIVLGMVFQGTLTERLSHESSVVADITQGEFDSVPYTSIGIRIHSWRAALEWIAERPLVGWGSEGRSLVMDHTSWLPVEVKERFGHLHNYLLEVWVAYGLLGVLVVFALAVWIGRGTWLAWRGGVMPNDVALFGAAFFVYWMVVNQFESYNSFGTGVYVHNLVVGGLVTHIWRWQRKTGRRVFPALKHKDMY
ncbi:O-antigen ligase family protein [Halomonas sp. ATCH28]|uniref:O-antigen ligase family protein n=1 Tax=Halomonas gemina TaxID=2945105 RepID=A0ABT0SXS6_9GAMM|nr:O-antigen ligase family protein [Halomonas gemina]MCL7939239.1 O-antigen ligase family protein [Halomonas gemina]